MGVVEIFLKVVRRIRPIRQVAQCLVRLTVSKVTLRKALNKLYNKLSYNEKEIFHSLFANIFRERKIKNHNGVWIVDYINRQIKLPLRKESLGLNWDLAVSILGHDSDIQLTYETLLKSDKRPSCFFDIGASYGTHTLLFLSQGIRSIAFEPNPICKFEFENLCRLNNLSGEMENIAIGEKEISAELWFPERDTWLGTIVQEIKDDLNQQHDLRSIRVPVIPLDQYVKKTGLQPDLIKIDTEGNELNIIKGARNTITNSKPLIIFESNDLDNRYKLFDIFEELDYSVCAIPILPNQLIEILNSKRFQMSQKFNFISVPNNHSIVNVNT